LIKLVFTVSLPIAFLDIITKKIVKSSFQYGESVRLLGNFLRFTYIENPGIAFGLFSDHHPLKNILLLLIGLAAVVFIFFMLRSSKNTFQRVSLAMILGGAFGNILERLFGYLIYFGEFKIFYGRVVDFIDIGIGDARWPYFNVADSFITIGIVLLIIYSLFFENKNKNKIEN